MILKQSILNREAQIEINQSRLHAISVNLGHNERDFSNPSRNPFQKLPKFTKSAY